MRSKVKSQKLKVKSFVRSIFVTCRVLKKNAGFTLVELVVTLGVMLTLLSLVTINLSYSQRHASVNSTITTLISDIKEQQLKAMTGDTEGRSTADSYGVHFTTSSYVLFHGSSYSAGDSSNRTVSIENTIQLSAAATDLIFTRVSGEVSGFSSGSNTITLQDNTNGEQKIIQYNQLGVITSVQ